MCRCKSIIKLILSLGLVIGLILLLSGQQTQSTQEDIFYKANTHTVKLYYHIAFKDIFGREVRDTATGSGVLVGKNLILTCFHMGTDMPIGEFKILFTHEGTSKWHGNLTIKKYDEFNDLLLLESKEEITSSPINLARGLPKIGDSIFFVGHTNLPVPRLRLYQYNFYVLRGIIVFPVFFGDSGGGVFNYNGELIGLIQVLYKITDHGNEQHTFVGYAVPLHIIEDFL